MRSFDFVSLVTMALVLVANGHAVHGNGGNVAPSAAPVQVGGGSGPVSSAGSAVTVTAIPFPSNGPVPPDNNGTVIGFPTFNCQCQCGGWGGPVPGGPPGSGIPLTVTAMPASGTFAIPSNGPVSSNGPVPSNGA